MPKKKLSRLFLVVFWTCFFAGMAFGQGVYEAWVARYNGALNSEDFATDIAVDYSGNVYATGQSNEDYVTIKYASNGDTLWVRSYSAPYGGPDFASALTVDDSGNVYVTGFGWTYFGTDDFATVKYAPNGDTVWARTAPKGFGSSSGKASAIAVDHSHNVYVTGGDYGYLTVKYTPNGDTLWVRRYNGAVNSVDAATALAVDDSGNVYVTGSSYGGGSSSDYATIKYAPNGDTLWVRRYNGPGNGQDEAFDLALDASGNVYVTGSSADTGSSSPFPYTYNDYATIKYAPNGDTLWVRRYNGPDNDADYANALAVDTAGNVYVTGGSIGSGTSYDYATIKYSPCSAIPGDANASGGITIGDIIHLVNYIFDKDKLPCLGIDPGNCWIPEPFCRGDVNQTTTITIGDIVHLVNYIFDKDKLPCLGSDPGNCWTPEASGACCLAVP